MTSPNNRVIAVLCTVLGLGGLFAIAYSGTGSDSRLAYALQLSLATITVFLAGAGVVRRDLPLLVMTAGLAAWSVDTFNPHGFLVYVGIALFLGGSFLMRSKHRTTIPRETGG
jgi:hypothetical protein